MPVVLLAADLSGVQGIGEQIDVGDHAESKLLIEKETAWLEVEGHE